MTTSTGKFTGRHMLFIMLAFFGVIFSVNGYMAYVAVDSWTGITARNGYVTSQNFNKNLAVQKRQDNLGIQSHLQYESGVLQFSFMDANGHPLTGYDVTLAVGRPTHESEDQKLRLSEGKPGYYSLSTSLAAGQWNVDILADKQGLASYNRRVRLGKVTRQ